MHSEAIVGHLRSVLDGMVQDLFVKSRRRIYITVRPADVVEATRRLHQDLGARFCIASGMEMETNFEILYHFMLENETSPLYGVLVSVRILLEKDQPVVDSITSGVPAAVWIEREMHELLGIGFRNHPDMRPLLLPEDWPKDVYPLRRGRPWEGKVDLKI